jgi:hypothetical protein
VVAVLAAWWCPSFWAGRYASDWFENDPSVVEPLAEGLYSSIESPLNAGSYGTGSARFDSEWHFGTYAMAALAFSQLGQLDRAEVALEHMLDPSSHAFDTEAFGVHADDDPFGDHAALLGYGNLALSVYREAGGTRFHDVNDRWTARLVGSFKARDLIYTYPGERYPVDNAAGIASLVVYARATEQPPPDWLDGWLERFEERQVIDGLLVQNALEPDLVRGSGTTLAAYFFAHADHPLSKTLSEGAMEQLYDTTWRFGALREYPVGVEGKGDIDSGPLILDYSISASGFGLSNARMRGDRARFRGLFSTVWVFGAPTLDRTQFVSGGPLGNAILLAMMTGPTP